MIELNGMLVQVFILCTGVIGQMYVAHLNVKGFYYWAASNVALIAVSWHFGGYGMVGLYAYFLIMAIYSIFHWRKRLEAERAAKAQHKELLMIASLFIDIADVPGASQEIALHVSRAKMIMRSNNQSGEQTAQKYPADFKMAKA